MDHLMYASSYYIAAEPYLSPQDFHTFAVHLLKKYKRNLTLIIEELESVTVMPLPEEAKENLEKLIVEEGRERVSRAFIGVFLFIV